MCSSVQGSSRSGWRRIRGRLAGRTSIPVGLSELRPADIDAWRELAGQAAEPNPFFEPETVLPAARHLGEAELGLLVARHADGSWLGCIPVSSRLRRGSHTLPVFSSWIHRYAFLGTPLVAGSEVERATEQLVDQLLRMGRLGVAALPHVGDGGPVTAGMRAALEARGLRPAVHRRIERPIMRRDSLSGGIEDLISSRHRRDLGRLARRLAEKLDAPLEVRDESQQAAAVGEFLALEASGWKGELGTAFASRPSDATFFTELCHGFREMGRLQLLAFGSAERAVSCKCNLLAGDVVFCFKIAYDDSMGRYRPGLQLELAMLELFLEQMDHAWMDSCADPGSALFEHIWPDRRPIGSYVLAASGALCTMINRGSARTAATSRSARR